MFENVLEVAENPAELVVYAALGKAARNWDEAKRIARALLKLEEHQTLVLQTGAAIGVLETGADAPMVVSAVNNTVGKWSTPERFYDRLAAGDTIWGGLTAAAWQYIGRQGVLGGTYELLRVIGEQRGVDLAHSWMLTAGLGGMGSSQPISAAMLGLSSLTVEVNPAKVEKLRLAGGLDLVAGTLDEALSAVTSAAEQGRTAAVGLVGNAAEIFPAVAARQVVPAIVTDQTAAHDVRYGYVPAGLSLDEWARLREFDPLAVETRARESIVAQVEAMLALQEDGAVVFENGNNLRVQALELLGADHADRVNRIPGFMEAYLRPLFSRGIGPFRWVALSGDEADLAVVDELAATMFGNRPEVATWIKLAREHIPVQGLPARSAWLGHGERSAIAVATNELVASGRISAPVFFSRDHLDSAGMTHPRIGTEAMRDGSDGVSDWPILDAMLLSSAGADLVAVHSGGGGYSGWMQSAGVSVVADGTAAAAARIAKALDLDTGLGVLRYATAGYLEAQASIEAGGETGRAPLIKL
jgi:urocanate hydratase